MCENPLVSRFQIVIQRQKYRLRILGIWTVLLGHLAKWWSHRQSKQIKALKWWAWLVLPNLIGLQLHRDPLSRIVWLSRTLLESPIAMRRRKIKRSTALISRLCEVVKTQFLNSLIQMKLSILTSVNKSRMLETWKLPATATMRMRILS